MTYDWYHASTWKGVITKTENSDETDKQWQTTVRAITPHRRKRTVRAITPHRPKGTVLDLFHFF